MRSHFLINVSKRVKKNFKHYKEKHYMTCGDNEQCLNILIPPLSQKSYLVRYKTRFWTCFVTCLNSRSIIVVQNKWCASNVLFNLVIVIDVLTVISSMSMALKKRGSCVY